MAEIIKSVDELKDKLGNKVGEFFISLNGCMRSSKVISHSSGTFYITNCIDDTEQELTEKQVMDKKYTNIGKAINSNAFYFDYFC